MGKKIDNETIAEVIKEFGSDKTDGEIAKVYNVSASYVNKLRSSQKRLSEKVDNVLDIAKPGDIYKKMAKSKSYEIVTDTSSIEEIKVLEMKISSMELTLKWYKELLEFKKAAQA